MAYGSLHRGYRGFGAAANTEDFYTGTNVPKYKSFQRALAYKFVPWAPDVTIDNLNWLMAYHVTGNASYPTELYLQSLAEASKGGPQLSEWLDLHCQGQWVVLFYDLDNDGAGSYLRMIDPNEIQNLEMMRRAGFTAFIVKKPDLSAPAFEDASRYHAGSLNVWPNTQLPFGNPPLIAYPPKANDLLPQVRSSEAPLTAGISSAGIVLIIAACVGGFLLLKRNGAFDGVR